MPICFNIYEIAHFMTLSKIGIVEKWIDLGYYGLWS